MGNYLDNIDSVRANLLRELEKRGGEANTSELKRAWGVDNPQRVKYRMKEMAEEALVVEEHQGLDSTGGSRPNLYRLTDEGRTVLNVYDLPGDGFENVLESRVSKLEREVRELKQLVEEIEERVADIEDRDWPEPDPWE